MLGIDVFLLSILEGVRLFVSFYDIFGEFRNLFLPERCFTGVLGEFRCRFFCFLDQHRSPHATTMPGGLLLHGTNNEDFFASQRWWGFFRNELGESEMGP